MIEYHYHIDLELDEENISLWLDRVINRFDFELGELNYYFVDDNELYKINMEYLNHDTLTDIISFDYTVGRIISGDIFISIDRVKENADELGQLFHVELRRVMSHGVLHYIGLKDKTDEEKVLMRNAEDEALALY